MADPILTLFQRTGDVRVASNILEEAISQAKEADPAKIGQMVSRFAGTGQQLGGFTVGESAGMVSAATMMGLTPEVAVTALEAATKSLRGDVSPATKAILAREGIGTDELEDTFKLIGERAQSGKISRAELEILGGAEALRLL